MKGGGTLSIYLDQLLIVQLQSHSSLLMQVQV